MKRRDFVAALCALAVWPLPTRAQPSMPVVGFVGSDTPDLYAGRLRAFRLGLRVIGFEEGRNVVIEYRWAQGRNDRLAALTDDLIGRKAAVIVAPTTPSALAAKAATQTIPIVFFVAGDPVQLGLVASLARPGRNITGATTLTLEVGAKRLELLHEMVPTAKVIAALVNPTSPNLAEIQSRDLQAAAGVFGLQLHVLQASTDGDFNGAFARARDLGAQGLVITSDSFFFSRSEQLADLAIRHKLPNIHGFRESVAAGGLMSYGGGLTESFRWLGIYAGQILKGEEPANLPVQQSTKVELIINFRTAVAIGLQVPPTLIARADDVIE
jgi:putative tryptophan/tyrosine transport system substrate-binding protein